MSESIKRFLEIMAKSGQIERYKNPIIPGRFWDAVAWLLIGMMIGFALAVVFIDKFVPITKGGI
jgi:hypothetical protein